MSRRDARERVLAALYQAEQTGRSPDLTGASPKVRRLAEGVVGHREELDEVLEGASAQWRVDRMPPVDRNLLRIGLYELRYEPETPAAVVIAEAVRLAKVYSTERSGAFVNGVLGRLAKVERPGRT